LPVVLLQHLQDGPLAASQLRWCVGGHGESVRPSPRASRPLGSTADTMPAPLAHAAQDDAPDRTSRCEEDNPAAVFLYPGHPDSSAEGDTTEVLRFHLLDRNDVLLRRSTQVRLNALLPYDSRHTGTGDPRVEQD